MTTTAHEDQYTTAPEPVRQPYDTVAILRRNVADLEVALRKQTERAESYAETLRSIASYVGAGGYNADTVDADVFEEKIRWGIGEIMKRMEKVEAELAKAREQKPIKYLYRVTDCFGHDVLRDDPKGATILETIPLYSAPVTAPAVPTHVIPEGDDFNGTTPHMIRCIESLVSMNDRGALVPHGLCGHSRTLLLASANRLRQQQAHVVPAVPEEWRETLSKLVGIVESSAKFHGCNGVTKQARALLQSSEVTDNAAADRLLEGE